MELIKIPKYIDKLLDRRAKAAETFLDCDCKIYDWLEKNNVKTPPDHILTGACSLFEPADSANVIRDCILEKQKKG